MDDGEPGAYPSPGWRDAILDSIADGVFTVDEDWKITYFNRAAEEITGIKTQDALGRYCFEVFKANICEDDCCLRQTLETGKSNVHKTAYIIRHDGKRIPISISTAVLRDQAGKIVGGVETFRNLTVTEALRKELRQRSSFGDIVSKNAEDPRNPEHSSPGGAFRRHGACSRRDRHGQGTFCPGHSHLEPSQAGPVRDYQLWRST